MHICVLHGKGDLLKKLLMPVGGGRRHRPRIESATAVGLLYSFRQLLQYVDDRSIVSTIVYIVHESFSALRKNRTVCAFGEHISYCKLHSFLNFVVRAHALC